MTKRRRERFGFKALLEGARLMQERTKLEGMRDQLSRCGLDREAKRLQEQITGLTLRISEQERIAQADRRELARQMLIGFAAGDVATVAADGISAVFEAKCFGRDNQLGQDLATGLRYHAESWNAFVRQIDGDGETPMNLQAYYADMADAIVEAVMPVIECEIDKWMNTPKGKALF